MVAAERSIQNNEAQNTCVSFLPNPLSEYTLPIQKYALIAEQLGENNFLDCSKKRALFVYMTFYFGFKSEGNTQFTLEEVSKLLKLKEVEIDQSQTIFLKMETADALLDEAGVLIYDTFFKDGRLLPKEARHNWDYINELFQQGLNSFEVALVVGTTPSSIHNGKSLKKSAGKHNLETLQEETA